jgi:hypothetical protein
MEKVTYKEIASGSIGENKSLVISECSRGGFTLGQKLTVNDGGKNIDIFLKGAIHIDSIESLENICRAFEKALEMKKS